MTFSENQDWFFPIANFGTKQGLNDSGLETFLDNPLESLVRETIQNSLDAKQPGNKNPVKVKFDFFNRPIADFPGHDSLIKEYIPESLSSWESDSLENQYLHGFSNALKSNSTVSILRIADFNTTGLDERNWNALVTETGVSSKRDTQAAGSKGIGKNAPFASSFYRTVIYNTKTVNYEKSIGVMVGVSYVERDGDGVSQARGYLGSEHNKPFDHQYSFLRDRDEIGTDVFVVGVKREYAEAQPTIILNVLEHFMLSIHSGTLEVEVDSSIINRDTLSEYVEGLSVSLDNDAEERITKIKSYLEVLSNDDTREIFLDDMFVKKYPFIDRKDDASFLLLPSDVLSATNKVLMARKSGMKIKERHFKMGVYFTGIFQATGSGINTFLRTLESAEHDNWVAERAEYDQQPEARRFLNDLESFLREEIRALIEDNSDETIDAYGLAELLPDEDTLENQSKEENIGSISTALADVTIKPARKVKQQLRYEDENPDIEGGDDGTEPGEGKRVKPQTNPPGPPSPNPDPPKGGPSKSLSEVTDARIRFIEVDYKNGLYLIRAIPSRTLANARIKIAVSGESADYSLRIESVDGKSATIVNNDSIEIAELPAEALTELSIKINYGYRVRMKAVIYESK